jgi:hypothetical protein
MPRPVPIHHGFRCHSGDGGMVAVPHWAARSSLRLRWVINKPRSVVCK